MHGRRGRGNYSPILVPIDVVEVRRVLVFTSLSVPVVIVLVRDQASRGLDHVWSAPLDTKSTSAVLCLRDTLYK